MNHDIRITAQERMDKEKYVRLYVLALLDLARQELKAEQSQADEADPKRSARRREAS